MLGKVTKRLLASSLISVSIFSMLGCSNAQSSKSSDTASKPAAVLPRDGAPDPYTWDSVPIEPTKIFDNLYYVGSKYIGASLSI